MASEFQRRKVAAVSDAMDADGNGFLEEEDFRALTERWVSIRGCEPGSPEYERIEAVMMGWWPALLEASDSDGDGKVSLDEVMIVVDRHENGDGRISLEEHQQVVAGWKGTDAGVEEVFDRLDLNGDGHLSQAEFRELWGEFWRGDDEAHPGQWVLGPY